MKLMLMDGVKKEQDFIAFDPENVKKDARIIGALCEDKFFAPMVYPGYCTAKVIETWLEKSLLPHIDAPSVILMDNAPFHNSLKIRQLIEQAKTWRCRFPSRQSF